MSGKFEKTSGQRKQNTALTVCVAAAIFLVLALLVWAVLRSASEESSAGVTVINGQEVPHGTVIEEVVDMMTVETPYGKLDYPVKWEDAVQITRVENNGVLTLFFAGRVGEEMYPLFEVVFGGETELNWGWILLEDGTSMPLGINYDPEPDNPQWGTEELDLFCAMQEDSNYLMASASELESFLAQKSAAYAPVPTEAAAEPVVIDTPYALLTFPGEWSQMLSTAVEDDGSHCAVHFTADIQGKIQELFVIHFGGEGEFLLGTLPDGDGGTVTVSFDFPALEFDSAWTQEEMNMVCAMQEEINSLIGTLQLTEGFVPAES